LETGYHEVGRFGIEMDWRVVMPQDELKGRIRRSLFLKPQKMASTSRYLLLDLSRPGLGFDFRGQGREPRLA